MNRKLSSGGHAARQQPDGQPGRGRAYAAPKAYDLPYKLRAYTGLVFTRLQLLDENWGLDSESDAGTVNVHISRLRKRFESYPEFELVFGREQGYKAAEALSSVEILRSDFISN